MPKTWPCSRRFSRPVASRSSPPAWETTPIDSRTWAGSRRMSWPATVAEPPSGWASVVRIFTVVDLPAPFGPSSPKTVPAGTEKVRPSSACTSSP